MRMFISSLTAAALIASPALAAPKTAAPAKTTTPSIAKAAKVEGESVKTEAKEHRAAARHHAASCGCPTKYAKSHKMMHKTAAKKASTTAKKG